MVRLNREDNPIPGEKPGYLPQYIDEQGTPITVTPSTPYPTRDKELELVKAELQAIKNQLDGTLSTQLTGNNLEEQLTESNAVSGVLTFSEEVQAIEIYNRDTNNGTFIVNGISIVVPPDEAFQARIGGSPSPNITVSGSTSYIVGRYS